MTQRFFGLGGLSLALVASACTGTIAGSGPDGNGGSSPGGTGSTLAGANSSGTGSTTPGNSGGSSGAAPGTSGGANGSSGSTSTAGGPSSNTGGSSSTGGAAGATSSTPGQIYIKGSPKYYRVVRLTNDQWTNSVQGGLALPARPTLAEAFQNAVSGTTDFTNNELVLDVDSRGWSDYQTAAEKLAAQVTTDAAQLSKVYAGTDPAGFINSVGRRLYRRPLSSAETSAYQKLFDSGATILSGTQSAFVKGAKMVLETMLQSPFFLYRTELGATSAPLTGYELAAKLSLLLRNTAPDDTLLDSAKSGSLDSVDGAASTAQKMLEEPASKAVMRSFHGQFLHFDRFADLSKVGVANYDPNINPELAESSYLFFDKVFSQGLGVKDIFLSKQGFVGANMAPLYGGGVTAPGSGLAERELGANRVGYFTQLPYLMLHAHNADSDSIHRGVTMSLDVLCAPLGPPAAQLPPLPTRMPGETSRQLVDRHTGVCGSACHNTMINPLGFAFENFDGMGQYRETERNGNDMLPLDASGSFNFVDGTKSWKNASELMQLLASNPQTHLCYSKKLASFGLQRDIVPADRPLLDALAAVSTGGSGSVKQVIVNLVKQAAFRTRGAQ